VGVEPDDSGVAHRCVTATLHLQSGADGGNRTRRLRFGGPACHRNTSPAWWSRWETEVSIDVGARRRGPSICVGRVGIEPTLRRIKSPLQSQRLLPTRWSHPLESNQSLSAFNRARQHQLRKSGKDRATHGSNAAMRGAGFYLWMPARASSSSSSLFGCQRAPLRTRWAHLGPRCDRHCGSRTCRGLTIWISDHEFAKTDCGYYSRMLPDEPETTTGRLVSLAARGRVDVRSRHALSRPPGS
jgi:hypothetical protein